MGKVAARGVRGRTATRWWGGLLVLLAAVAAPAAPPDTPVAGAPPVADAEPVLERVVAIGASATHGFRASLLVPVDGRLQPRTASLSDALAAVLPAAGAVHGSGTEWFFRDPDGQGRAMLDAGLAHRPTLLVGVDQLFWFGYGATGHRPGTPEDARIRRARLERGLAMLEPVEVPLLVGDLPDMSGAIGGLLAARQVPAADVRDELNARIRAWVDERETRHLVPLADTMRRLTAGERFGVPGRYPLLKPDRLHPTADGLLVMARTIAETARDAGLGIRPEDLELEHGPAVERLQARLGAATPAAPTDPDAAREG